jgi:uncharacterized protein (TIGR02118 family)
MYKIIALFYDAEDEQAFITYYEKEFVPLLLSLQGVMKVEVTRLATSLPFTGEPSPCFLMGQMYFSSQEALEHTLSSLQGMEAARVFLEQAGDISTVFVGQCDTHYSSV